MTLAEENYQLQHFSALYTSLSLVFSSAQEISELSSSLERALDYWTKNRWRRNDWHFFSFFFQIMTNLRLCSFNFRLCRPSHRLENRCVLRHIFNINFQSWDVIGSQGCREKINATSMLLLRPVILCFHGHFFNTLALYDMKL